MKKNLEIISLIYKSTDYLNLIANELKNNCKVPDWNVGIRIVANDANSSVLNALPTIGVPYSIYNDKIPNDYYLNRVYRCWNFSAQTSNYENICFVNSDMMFSKDWLRNLLKYHDGINIPTSRLIESGKLLSGKYAITYDCGKSPKLLDREKWTIFSDKISEDTFYYGGLFMPCIFEKSKFISAGMYPEGNIYNDGIGTLNGKKLISGDAWFFNKLEKFFGMKHITVFNSLVYHIQEGEMGE